MNRGLQDVVLGPETGDIDTPNTNQMVNGGSLNGLTAGGQSGIIKGKESSAESPESVT